MYNAQVLLLISEQRHRDLIHRANHRKMADETFPAQNRRAGKKLGAILRTLRTVWF